MIEGVKEMGPGVLTGRKEDTPRSTPLSSPLSVTTGSVGRPEGSTGHVSPRKPLSRPPNVVERVTLDPRGRTFLLFLLCRTVNGFHLGSGEVGRHTLSCHLSTNSRNWSP